jgi:hypothetical protein
MNCLKQERDKKALILLIKNYCVSSIFTFIFYFLLIFSLSRHEELKVLKSDVNDGVDQFEWWIRKSLCN